MKKENKGNGIIIGSSVGVLAGVIAGIMLASKSGKDTRDDIAKYLSEIKDKIADELSQIGDVTRDVYDSVIDTVVTVYESSKKISANDASEIKKNLDDNYDKVVKTIRAKKAVAVEKAK